MDNHFVIITTNNINIKDSYQIKKKCFHNFYNYVKYIEPKCEVIIKRKYASLDFEWVTHNAIYYIAKFFKINKLVDRVKDVDLNYPQKWYVNWAYNILGVICWIFIK